MQELIGDYAALLESTQSSTEESGVDNNNKSRKANLDRGKVCGVGYPATPIRLP